MEYHQEKALLGRIIYFSNKINNKKDFPKNMTFQLIMLLNPSKNQSLKEEIHHREVEAH